MLEFNAERFVRAMSALDGLRIGLKSIIKPPQQAPDGSYSDFFDDGNAFDVMQLIQLRDDLIAIGATISAKSIQRMIDYQAEVQKQTLVMSAGKMLSFANEAAGRIKDELDDKKFLHLSPQEAEIYSKSSHFGPDVQAKFPRAAYEIDEAAKCLALGRSTAATFHLMRALEVALKAVAACLEVTPPSNPNWGTWLNAIRDERLKRSTQKKWVESDFFQDVWLRLDAVKDAQRNSTLHVERIYTEAEARDVFKTTRSFMQKIASRMDEAGAPLA
jgi:HEPN domain-containing protein